MRTFEARYPGTCACCGEHFDEGDEIAYVDEGIIAHAECAKDEEEYEHA